MNICCPLCGRHVPEKVFDPGSLDTDIYAVIVSGLGRGKGFSVSEPFSVLGDPVITTPIAHRCRNIIKIIEGKEPSTEGEFIVIKAELEALNKKVQREQGARKNLLAKLAEQEGQSRLWRSEAIKMQRMRDEDTAKLVTLENEIGEWQKTAVGLRAEVTRLEARVNAENSEDENLASEEMDDLLDMINSSANTSFEYLIDAVKFLLEGG